MAVMKRPVSRTTKPPVCGTTPAKLRLRPLEDFILVDITPPETASKGGIILPESAQGVTNRGKVVAAGPGLVVQGSLVPTTVKPGDQVLFEQYAGSEVTIDETKYRIFRQPSIIAVLDG
jgi:chaperonin GroES